MPNPLSSDRISAISQYDAEKRYQYLLDEVISNQEIWVLTDEHGCVMLNAEDEDCVPVWPNKVFAEAWATGEWSDCNAEAVSLDKWLKSWTSGLMDDDIAVAIFPNQEEEGLVIMPDEFDFELKRK